LDRLARRKSVVLFIDDLQWGDTDSAALLESLFRPPRPPPVLWVACFRGEEAGTSPLLRTLLPSQSAWASEVHRSELALNELTLQEARELAHGLLRKGSVARAEAIAQEAGGNPFLIYELVRSAGESGEAPVTSLGNIILSRVSRLPEGARLFLELVAVAGQPIALEVVKRAAKIQGEDEAVLGVLRARYLVRTRRTESWIEVETYHDRTREAVSQHLSSSVLKAHHGLLATELEASGRADPEILVTHFQGAGEQAKAAQLALAAGDRASSALAFDRAARLYRTALELDSDRSIQTPHLREKLGDALTNAGRGGEAAEAYLGAVAGVTGVDKLELQRRAAAQFMLSGRIDEGLDVARGVLEAVGVSLAKSMHRSILRFVVWRVRIRLRGLSFHERDVAQISAEECIRIDTCFSVMQGLAMVDTFWAQEFHARNLVYSLEAGDIYRIARALVSEAGVHAILGGRNRRRGQEVLELAKMSAERSANPHAVGLAALQSGVFAFLRGEWAECRRRMDHAEATLRGQCTGVAWEIATAQMMATMSLVFMGELKLLKERLPSLLQEAEGRGDRYKGNDFRGRVAHLLPLIDDQPERAYAQVKMFLTHSPGRAYHLHHWWALLARLETDFYCGRGRAAWAEVSRQWGPFRRTLATRVQFLNILSRHHRASAALVFAEDCNLRNRERRRLIRTAEREAARIEREQMPWGLGLAALLRAGVAARRGNTGEAARLLTAAETILESTDMPLYAAAARRRRGELIAGDEGDEGRALIADSDFFMLKQEIRNPGRMAAMLAPGVSRFRPG
jgi:hypothetical protein